MKHGTYAIHNVQTGQNTHTQLGECMPSQVDLHEHEEIRIWSDEANDFIPVDPKPTRVQTLINAIRADLIESDTWRESAEDKLDELEKLL